MLYKSYYLLKLEPRSIVKNVNDHLRNGSRVKLSKTLLDAVREERSDRYGSGRYLDRGQRPGLDEKRQSKKVPALTR